MMNSVINTEAFDSNWKSLYKAGGAAALIVVVLTLAEVIGFSLYPQPNAVSDWFTLFQSSRFMGLLDFWGLELPMYVMFAVVFLALYIALRRVNESYMAIALTLALLGVGVFLATNNPFSMLALSDQYAAATSDAERSTLLAAGQAVLVNTGQRAVGGFNTGLFLVSAAGLIVSWVMVQSQNFTRFTANVGMVAFALSIADFLRQALTQSELVALFIILLNAVFVMLWFSLVGRQLWLAERFEGKTLPKQA